MLLKLSGVYRVKSLFRPICLHSKTQYHASVALETIWLVGPIGLRFQPVIFHNYRIEMYVWCIAVCGN